MKVALKDIKPNPWRHLNKGYPIDEKKVDELRRSMKQNEYWGGIVGRKAKENGYVEIAFGHHRIAALRKDNPPTHEIEIAIRDLDERQMLQFMAAENSTLHEMSPAVINETVRAAMEFLKEPLEILLETAHRGKSPERKVPGDLIQLIERAKVQKSSSTALLVAEFLSWPIKRISEAFAALHAIETGVISKEEYEAIPNQKMAVVYRKEVTRTPIPKASRTVIVNKLKSHEIGIKQVRQEVQDAKFPLGKPKKTKLDIDDVADQITKHVLEATVLMTPEFMASCDEVSGGSLQRLSRAVNSFIGKLRQVKGKQLLIGEGSKQ